MGCGGFEGPGPSNTFLHSYFLSVSVDFTAMYLYVDMNTMFNSQRDLFMVEAGFGGM